MFDVGELTLGYRWDFLRHEHTALGIGAAGTLSQVPSELHARVRQHSGRGAPIPARGAAIGSVMAESHPRHHHPAPAGSTATEPAAKPNALAARTQWTCPMHPQIVRDAPGSCPICGMALEPRTITAEQPENPELVDMRRRFRVAVALTAPLVLMMLSALVPGQSLHHLLPIAATGWIELALAAPVVLWCGWPFLVRGWRSIVDRSPNMFHTDRARHGGGLPLQRRDRGDTRPLPRLLPRRERAPRHLFRGRRRDRDARAPGAGPRAAGARPHQFRDPRTPPHGARECAPAPRRRNRGRPPARSGAGG